MVRVKYFIYLPLGGCKDWDCRVLGTLIAYFVDWIAAIGFTMAFQVVCTKCDSVGVTMDHGELAAPSTIVRCSHCEAVRGTLGELRNLANSPQRDLFNTADLSGSDPRL